jgi:hypothetical protein
MFGCARLCNEAVCAGPGFRDSQSSEAGRIESFLCRNRRAPRHFDASLRRAETANALARGGQR